jgi:hypothetical protein
MEFFRETEKGGEIILAFVLREIAYGVNQSLCFPSLYGLEVSPDLISTITDEVMTEVAKWQASPLDVMYPIVYFHALRLKICDEGTVRNKAVYRAQGCAGAVDRIFHSVLESKEVYCTVNAK